MRSYMYSRILLIESRKFKIANRAMVLLGMKMLGI